MTSIQADLKQPQLLAIPDDPRLLNHRALLCGTLVSGKHVIPKAGMMGFLKYVMSDISPWIIHLGIWDMKSHLAGLKATFGALRILTERRSW